MNEARREVHHGTASAEWRNIGMLAWDSLSHGHAVGGTFDMAAGNLTRRDRNRNKSVRIIIHPLVLSASRWGNRNVGVSSITTNGSHGRVRGSVP